MDICEILKKCPAHTKFWFGAHGVTKVSWASLYLWFQECVSARACVYMCTFSFFGFYSSFLTSEWSGFLICWCWGMRLLVDKGMEGTIKNLVVPRLFGGRQTSPPNYMSFFWQGRLPVTTYINEKISAFTRGERQPVGYLIPGLQGQWCLKMLCWWYLSYIYVLYEPFNRMWSEENNLIFSLQYNSSYSHKRN